MKTPLLVFLAAVLITGVGVGIFYALQDPGDPDDFIPMSELSKIERTNKMVKYEVENAQERGAVCNDGTAAVFYYREGENKNTNDWIIHLQGGGSCGYDEECIDRWKTQRFRMSSSSYPNQMAGSGIMSPDPDKNPYFADYNHVYVKYCSSDVWAGNNTVEIMNQDVIFAGAQIVDSVFEDLQNEDVMPGPTIKNADEILLTGSSAGGYGVTHNLDRITESFPDARVTGINDSSWNMTGDLTPPEGYEPDYPLTAEESMAYHNPRLDESCVEDHEDEPWQCRKPAYAGDYIETPFFLYIDQVDKLHLGNRGINDLNESMQQQYRNEYAEIIKDDIEDIDGVFSSRVGQHTALTNPHFLSIMVDGYNYMQVLASWYFDLDGPTHVVEGSEIW
ncbi:MAG: pectin acetylesterase-family hydrolase [Patescibacteria group bacterium]